MKLSFIILMLTFLQVSASSFAQKVNIQVKDASINEVFYKLTQQTGHTFTADAALIKKIGRINLNMSNRTLKEVLEKCFEGYDIKMFFNEEDKIVTIKSTGSKVVAQPSVTVTGKVTDEKGEPLVGVGIKVKDMQAGTITDVNGNYKINVPNKETILVFSYLGFVTQEKSIGSNNVLNIRLVQEVSKLDEIVVVGYGEVKRGDLTGAVGQVNIDDLNKAPVAVIDQALAGRIAGVQVSSNDGQPGTESEIIIRGGNSLTQSNSPLYVVDGFPIEGFSLTSLNSDDIASISILKDASSTAIYGSRGANGVVIIETKKGKIGEPVITYNNLIGTQNTIKRMELMSPYEFVKYQLELDSASMSQRYLTNRQMSLEDYRSLESIDWQDLFFREAFMQNHALSLRGGNNKTKYSVSLSVTDQDGVIINSGFQRQVGRITLNQDINKRLKAGFIVNYSRDKNFGSITTAQATSEGGYASYLMYRVWGYRPLSVGTDIIEDLFDDEIDGAEGAYILTMNPIITTENEIRQQSRNHLFTSISLNYEIAKNLNLNVRGGYTNVTTTNEAFYNAKTWQGYPSPTNVKGINGRYSNANSANWMNENTLNYKKRINSNHQFEALAGVTMQGSEPINYGYEVFNIPNEALGLRALQLGIPTSVISTGSKNTLVSYLSRVNYNFKSKYLFTGSLRADGSSKFSKSERWGFFPSAAFAWQMGREEFLKNSRIINDSKLRLSYGITGNNRISDFARYTTIGFNDYYSFGNGTPGYAALLSGLGNEFLKWERTAQLDIGYELSLFNNRINITTDLYRKVTKDLLLYSDLPYSSGYSRVYRNVGSVQNDGLEISINTKNIETRNFAWSSDFNISFNKNKVLALADNQSNLFSSVNFTADFNNVPLYITKIGGPASAFYGIVWDGVYQYEDFDKRADGTYVLKPSVVTNGNDASVIQPGDIKYKDQNGDGVVDEKDRVVIGRTLPKHFGGFNNNFTYKRISLNVFFQWSYGNDVMNANRMLFEGSYNNRYHLNQYSTYEQRWSPESPSNDLYRTRGAGPIGVYSSRTIEDGSFLRLKTVRLAYSFPKGIQGKFKKADVFLAGQNLYTWTKYTGMDPEVSTRHSTLTPGFDYSAYARALTLTAGVNITF